MMIFGPLSHARSYEIRLLTVLVIIHSLALAATILAPGREYDIHSLALASTSCDESMRMDLGLNGRPVKTSLSALPSLVSLT
jgi:hypothetical protein